MKYKLQPFNIPVGCKILKNDFTVYDPNIEFSEDKNLYYLTEDLLQLEFEDNNLTVDLGWYGEISTNKGFFKVIVIQNDNWDSPLCTETSESQKVITEKLEGILTSLKNGK